MESEVRGVRETTTGQKFLPAGRTHGVRSGRFRCYQSRSFGPAAAVAAAASFAARNGISVCHTVPAGHENLSKTSGFIVMEYPGADGAM